MGTDQFPRTLLSPPETFGIVEKGVYRSETLKISHFSFIQPLNIQTLLVLSPEPPSKPVLAFLAENNIKLIHPLSGTGSTGSLWKLSNDELIKVGLEIVLSSKNHPILINCRTGYHETSTLVGCLRRMQNWNFNSIIIEYRAFAKTKYKIANEHFIELFDSEVLNLPPDVPAWIS